MESIATSSENGLYMHAQTVCIHCIYSRSFPCGLRPGNEGYTINLPVQQQVMVAPISIMYIINTIIHEIIIFLVPLDYSAQSDLNHPLPKHEPCKTIIIMQVHVARATLYSLVFETLSTSRWPHFSGINDHIIYVAIVCCYTNLNI